MATKGQSITLTYGAWSVDTGETVTSDVSNHTCRISPDGGAFATATNSPTELGYGVYKLTLTASETNCDSLTLQVSSTTSGVVIPPVQITFDEATSVPSASDIATTVWGASSRTITNTIPSTTDIADAVWTKDLESYSYTSPPGMAYKYIIVDSTVISNIALDVGDLPADVWGYSFGRTLTASPTDISGLATAMALSSVASDVTDIKANATDIKTKTDNLPSNPAAQGAQMSLTNETIQAVQSGLAKTSDLAGLSTFDPSTDTVTIDATQAAGMATATGFATPSDIPTDYAKATDIPTDYTKRSDLSGLSTFDPTTDTVTIDATQAAGMATATGFATPNDITSAVSGLETYGDAHWQGGSSGGGATAQQIWEYAGGRTLTASPTDISGLATSSALLAVASDVSAIKVKTDNLPASPAATGDIPSVASIQSGLAKTSDLSGLSTFDPSTDTVLIDATQAAGMATATGFATPSDIPTDYAKATDIPTDYAKKSDLSGLSTFDPSTDTVLIDSTQAAGMATATGFATPNDITSAVSDLETYGDTHWQGGGSGGGATAQQIWEYSGARTLTASPTDISSLATKTDLNAAQTAITSAMPSTSGLATSQNVTDAKNAIIGSIPTIPTDYAKSSELSGLSTLTTSDIPTPQQITAAITSDTTITNLIDTLNKIYAGLFEWTVNADTLTLKTSEGVTIKTYYLTRDANNSIIKISERYG